MLAFHVTGGRCSGPLLVERGGGIAAVRGLEGDAKVCWFWWWQARMLVYSRILLTIQVVAALGMLPPSTPPEKANSQAIVTHLKIRRNGLQTPMLYFSTSLSLWHTTFKYYLRSLLWFVPTARGSRRHRGNVNFLRGQRWRQMDANVSRSGSSPRKQVPPFAYN